MKRILRLAAMGCACALPLARAQNVVFNDSFTSDQLNPSTYPTVTSSSTGFQVLSSKSAPAPTESTQVLTINMVSTSSGFIETQALFSPSLVKLLPGTYIELTASFVPTAINTVASDNLIFGMFNSGGTPPIAGLMASGLSSGSTTFSSGGAKGWIGYNANIPFSGSPRVTTRPAQTGASNIVQDVVIGGQSSSAGYASGVNASGVGTLSSALTTGSTYTADYKLSLSSDGLTLTSTVSLFNGTTTNASAKIGSYNATFSGTTLLTTQFDAMAIGWRADSSTAGSLKISALSVRTTGGTPWFTTLPPSNMTVTLGDSLNLNAVAAGTGPITYQWQFSSDNGATYANINATTNPSAATASLTLTNVQNSNAGKYRLTAANAAGTSTSAVTTVTTSLTPVPPSVSIDPVGNTVLAGSAQTFSVTVNGSSPLSYQWQYSSDNVTFTPISGATNASYTIPATALTDEGYYNVIVSNGAGNATSGSAQLVVNQPLTVTNQPVGAALNVGDSYTLSVAAAGKPAPSGYQWKRNGVAISGATNQTYAITSASAASAGVYTVTVTSSTDSTTSNSAAIAVISPTFTATSATPNSGSSGLSPDTRITVTFSGPVSVGVSGTIKIFDTANSITPVDTIDLVAGTANMTTLRAGSTLSTQALPVLTKTIGTATNFNYYPITISGSTATIYPRNGVLVYGHSYYVTVDPGVFLDGTGLSWAGISSNTGYTFSTKVAGPMSNATRITVAPDGTGDFCTVQGAIDWVSTTNATLRTIFIRRGTYFEQVYFTGKSQVTFVGEDRAQTIITYPNNNNFNSGGTTRRMVFCGDKNNFISILNLTIANSTPNGGSQAEALVLNGNAGSNPAIVESVDLTSYQDTLLAQGQVYVTNCHISGNVDFMWGSGPAFFDNCQLTQLSSGGYFTQVRNPATTHGFVYSNCVFNALAGVSGAYFGRIDPAAFSNSEVVLLDSTVGNSTNNAFLNTTSGVSGSNYSAAWWLLNNAAAAASAPSVHNWSNNLVDGTGSPLTSPNTDAFTVMPTDATTQANYRNKSWVLNWTPQLAPIFATTPAAQSLAPGAGLTLTAQGFGVPAVTYQWYRNGTAITGATNASYAVASVAAGDAGSYSVAISNANGTVTSSSTSVVVAGAAPVILVQPASTAALPGTTATFSVYAVGDAPISYQWSKDGTPISGATNTSLRLTGFSSAAVGNYTVAVTNAGGTTQSAAATLTLDTPATTVPRLPVVRAVRYDVTAAPFNATGDGATDNTAAIQAAINAAAAAGGGIVELPGAPSAYLCGPITLANNIDLQVDGGATLLALPYGTYPNSFSSPAHFITVPSGASHVELSGNGTIDGNGNPWWAAFNANGNQGRPRLVQITKATNILITGLRLQNSPMFHLAFSGANSNVTIYGITISAPGDSPNTDGMDLAGSNFLVQGCTIADGDDNIVAKPGSVFCQNLYIANCTIGTGHGVSVGGQTNVGMNGMTVTNCTFNGTDTGLRLKADATQGGPVQNLTFTNLTMTNVPSPIVFYSYYNQIGSPGATSGSSQTTVSKVNAFNAAPPNPLTATTIPTWQNVTISNLTATGAGAYSIIWGLPLGNALIQGVTLSNVNISGGSGFELYDATNVQFTGSNSVGAFVTCNALAITGQPQSQAAAVGGTVSFSATAIGGSGSTGTAPTYQWNFNGAALTDGLQSDGATISGSATSTLTITNVRAGRAGNYRVVATTSLDGYSTGSGALVNNSLPVSATSAAATLTIAALPATISVSNLTWTYDGTAKAPTVTTSPAGLPVAITYNGSASPAVNAGNYTLGVSVTDPNYAATAFSGTLVIQPAVATIGLSGLAPTYDGTPKAAAVTTTPAGLAVSLTYNGAAATPTNAGSYVVSATLANPNYSATAASGTLTIGKAAATVALTSLTQAYDGTAKTVTIATVPAGLATTTTYNGLAVAPTAAGSYAVVTSIADPNYQGSASGSLTITKGAATLTLGGLAQVYDGTAKAATVTSSPAIATTTTYNGSATAPTAAGSYAVSVTSADPNFTASATGTLVISKASQTITVQTSAVSLNTPILLSATATSGLPVTFAIVSGGGTIAGNTLTLTAVGTTFLRASQAGNANYNATSIDFAVGVTGNRPQTITFAPISAHSAIDPAFNLIASASSGLPVSFAVISGPALLSGSRLTLTGAPGTVIVRASQGGDATWAAAPSVDQSFVVSDASVDTYFGDLSTDATTDSAAPGHHALAVTKAGDVAAAIVAGTQQGNVLIVASNLNAAVPITLNADGTYSATFTNNGQSLTLAGQLANGILTGEIPELHLHFSTTVQTRAGTTAAYAGFYSTSALNGNQGATYSVIGSDGRALVMVVTPTMTTGAVGQVNSDGSFSAAPSTGVTISGVVNPAAANVTTTVLSNGQSTNFAGVKDQVVRTDRLVNLSSRGFVSGGDKIVISGFVIGGSDPKQVLIRAVGPGLSAFSVVGVLPTPHLQLFQNGVVLADNTGWSTAANAADISAAGARVGAFALVAGSGDSAILTTLPPGAYTAMVSDGPNSGVVLTEIYDASVNPTAEYQRLVNISARGVVGTGEDILVGGFVVTGNAPKKVLIRAVGPGLAGAGVAGFLSDPKLQLFQNGTLLVENDNWGTGVGSAASDITSAVGKTGAFPLTSGSKDSAVVLQLAPGAYTVQVSGVGGATGIALIETYELP